MASIGALKNGVATKVTIMRDGKEVELKLAIVARRRWDPPGKDEDYDFKYVSADGAIACGFYSGGLTGGGVDSFVSRPEEFRIVTTDLSEILRMGEAADRAAADAKVRHDAAIAKAVEKLNTLPTEIFVMKFGDAEYLLRRSTAEHNPYRSHKFKPIITVHKRISGHVFNVWLDNYYTKTGSFLRKKAVADLGPQAELLLSALKREVDALQAEIDEIARQSYI